MASTPNKVSHETYQAALAARADAKTKSAHISTALDEANAELRALVAARARAASSRELDELKVAAKKLLTHELFDEDPVQWVRKAADATKATMLEWAADAEAERDAARTLGAERRAEAARQAYMTKYTAVCELEKKVKGIGSATQTAAQSAAIAEQEARVKRLRAENEATNAAVAALNAQIRDMVAGHKAHLEAKGAKTRAAPGPKPYSPARSYIVAQEAFERKRAAALVILGRLRGAPDNQIFTFSKDDDAIFEALGVTRPTVGGQVLACIEEVEALSYDE